MDAWLLGPLGAAELHTARRSKGGSWLFKASATAADIYVVHREHYEWHLINEK